MARMTRRWAKGGGLAALAVMLTAGAALAHNEHMLIGRTADGQLTWSPAGVPDGQMTVLAFIPPGGPIEGFSAAVPGFSFVVSSSPEDDVYVLEPGANIWVEVLRIDAPLLLVETPSYVIVNDRVPMEMPIGTSSSAHAHPLWLLDTSDPAYDPSRCIWEVTLVLRDKGSTQYADSAPITFRFAAGAEPVPADLDCDGDVDGADFDIFAACATRSALPYDPENLPAGCPLAPDHAGFIRADIDRDGDVDLDDFGALQRCHSGENVPAGVNCAG
jgi:hypothetical protein